MPGDPSSLDDLVRAHLDGALDPAGLAELARRIEADPAARARFADLVARDLILAEKARESVQVQRPSVRRQAVPVRRRPVLRLVAAVAVAAGLVAAGAAWALVSAPAAPPAPAPVAALADGRPLAAGEVVAAGPAPVALAWPGEATRILLAPGGRVRLLPGVGKQLRLDQGLLSATVSPQAPGAPLVVTTPLATAVVVGTRFRLGHRSGSAAVTTLQVEEGTVRLEAGQAVAVRAGDRAQVDARGITLSTAVAGSGTGAVLAADLRLDAEPPPGSFVADHGWDRAPAAAVRIAHGDRTPTLLEGGPWPAFWAVQQWRPGSVGEFRFGPHPADGTRALRLRPISGSASAQVLTRPFPVAAEAATIYLRYRTSGAAQPALWLEVAGVRTRPITLPLSGPGWRWAAVTPAARTARERCVVVVQNYGRTPEDELAIGALLHGPGP
ncbi:MAG: FecR protein [Planctomycetota bacterium]|jgi:hypothetical protein